MVPLKVTWKLETPMVVPEHPIILDALLAKALFERALRDGHPDPIAASEDLPLEKHVASDGQWVWKASCLGLVHDSAPMLLARTRKTDIYGMARDRNRVYETKAALVNTGTGHLKLYNLRRAIQWMQEVSAWCVGDHQAITSLLGDVPSLGKERRCGFGRVKECTVVPSPDASQRWAQRALADSMTDLATDYHVVGLHPLRPPYWRRERAVAALIYVK